jgi:hypothetical protein
MHRCAAGRGPADADGGRTVSVRGRHRGVRDTAVPWLAETAGFRGALLFADPASGHLISETVWRDPAALAASPSAAAVARVGGGDPAQCVIQAVEEYILVFSSARKA